MKNLSKLGIDPHKLIKNDELLSLKGGEEKLPHCTGGEIIYECNCVNCVGTWLGCYTSQWAANASLDAWCGCTGGECHSSTPIEG